MRLALRLAARAAGRTDPNPMVGAVVVRAGRVAGTGYHHRAGEPHAEVLALRRAGAKARGATLYVSLEPCAHFGRTPPCTEAILRSGVRRVVAAMRDPNPLNRGRGLRILRAHGVNATVGILGKEALALNRVFMTRMRSRRPFVTVKIAQSLDGKIATRRGASRWISGPAAREWAHRLRAESDAVLVGIETVLKDDPRLTVRGMGRRSGRWSRDSRRQARDGRRPVRVILDSRLRTPPDARLFASKAPVWIAAATSAPGSRQARLEETGAEVLRVRAVGGRVGLRALLKELHRRGIGRLLIEGGGEVVASALEAGVVDRVAWVIAPKILGGSKAPTAVGGAGVSVPDQAIQLKGLSIRRLGSDLLVTGDVRRDH